MYRQNVNYNFIFVIKYRNFKLKHTKQKTILQNNIIFKDKEKIITSEVIFSAFGWEACKINETQHIFEAILDKCRISTKQKHKFKLNGQSCQL